MAAGLVGQDQITTFVSPVNGSTPIDANTVRGNDNTIKTAFNTHDADATIHFQSSTLAARPAASIAGQKWMTSDGYRIYYDDGATWHEAAYLTSVSPIFSGAFISTTAFATPSALSATQFTAFASTVSGATLMGYGTTADVTLKNRAGTDVLTLLANTSIVNIAGRVNASALVGQAPHYLATNVGGTTLAIQNLNASSYSEVLLKSYDSPATTDFIGGAVGYGNGTPGASAFQCNTYLQSYDLSTGNFIPVNVIQNNTAGAYLRLTFAADGSVTFYNRDAVFNGQTASMSLGTTGNFSIATNKFTVAASNGNTVVAGTFNVTGTTTAAAINAGAIAGTTGLFTSTLQSGSVTRLNDTGTSGARVEVQGISGELSAGAVIGSQYTTDGAWLFANRTAGTAGLKQGIGYFDGTTLRSAVEVAHTAAGFGTLTLMLSGGTVSIGGVVELLLAASARSGSIIGLGGTTQTTIGANGAASALTANPLGYLIAYKGATKIIIPYYNA